MRRLLGLLALVAGALAGLAILRRSRAEPRERIELYFADGSSVSLAASTSAGTRLMPLARRALASTRG